MSKAQSMGTAPKDRPVLVKHKGYGWIEATSPRGWWYNLGFGALLLRELLSWAELPEEAK